MSRFKQASWGEAFYRMASRGERGESYLEFLEREFPEGWRVIDVQRSDANMMSPPSVTVTAQRESTSAAQTPAEVEMELYRTGRLAGEPFYPAAKRG